MSDSDTISQLQQRRAEEQARLAEISLARDVLEKRSATHLAALAKEKARVSELEKRIESLEQRAGGGRLAKAANADETTGTAPQPRQSWSRRRLEMFWWRDTIRRARREHKRGQLINAQMLFDAALVVRRTPALWTELAHVLREQKLYDGAEAAYAEVLRDDPRNGEILFLAGYCTELAGNEIRAVRYYEDALKADPKLVERYDHLRDFHARLED